MPVWIHTPKKTINAHNVEEISVESVDNGDGPSYAVVVRTGKPETYAIAHALAAGVTTPEAQEKWAHEQREKIAQALGTESGVIDIAALTGTKKDEKEKKAVSDKSKNSDKSDNSTGPAPTREPDGQRTGIAAVDAKRDAYEANATTTGATDLTGDDLRGAKAKAKTTQDDAPDADVTVDTGDGLVDEVNRNTRQSFAIDPATDTQANADFPVEQETVKDRPNVGDSRGVDTGTAKVSAKAGDKASEKTGDTGPAKAK